MIKTFLKACALITGLIITPVTAQQLPAGSVGVVTNNAPNTWQTFTYTFRATTTGANFIGFAFRQDPAFWTFDNVRLTAAGSTTNLLTNGGFDNGGAFSVTTNNGPSQIQAPTNWGVWYQNGTYPAAAGQWQDGGAPHGGVWYDGAVGSFDGIYQGVNLTAGTTYTIAFEVSGNHTSDGGAVQLGAYSGACASVSVAPNQCTIPSSVGFTTLATPAQGAAAGGPAVTVVSTAPGTPRVTTSSANGASSVTNTSTRGLTITVSTNTAGVTTYTSSYRDAAVRNTRVIEVTRTTTVIGSTPMTRVDTLTTPITTVTTTTVPRTTTTTTILVTVTTYSDGTTTTSDGTPVVTTSTTNVVTSSSSTTNEVITQTTRSTNITSNSSNQSASASSNGFSDAVAVRRFNPFLVDALSKNDGAWVSPTASYYKTVGSISTGGTGAGYQWTADNNIFGVAVNYGSSKSNGLVNSKVQSENYDANAYALIKDKDVWVKTAVGFGYSKFNGTTALPIFALANNTKFNQKLIYGDLTVYSADTYFDFRPLVGVTVTNSSINGIVENGSALLSTTPESKSSTSFNPYVGLRYDFDKNFGVEGRVTQSKDFKTVGSIRATANTEIDKGIFLNASVGVDKSSNLTGIAGTIGLRIDF